MTLDIDSEERWLIVLALELLSWQWDNSATHAHITTLERTHRNDQLTRIDQLRRRLAQLAIEHDFTKQ